ncbi:MAG: pilus assembly protein N-terminal domain-containing protein [Bacteriovoracaceae bacterium]|nr:pilus assembly protein N-terminal domain-containing protein [Bacteriovoracaceae bacterium]
MKKLFISFLFFLSFQSLSQEVPPAPLENEKVVEALVPPELSPVAEVNVPKVPEAPEVIKEETATAEKELEVVVGIDVIEKLDFESDRRIQIGAPDLLSTVLVPQKNEIIFKGAKEGKTSVTIRDKAGDVRARYLVRVITNSLSKTVQQLREYLGDIEGLEIGIKGEKVYVGGNLVVPTDIGRISTVLQSYPAVMSLIQLSPQTKDIISKKMQVEIQNNGMKDVSVRVVNGVFWLEGVVSSQDEFQYAEKIAMAYLPDKIKPLALQSASQFEMLDRKDLINFLVVNVKKEPQPAPKLIKITSQFVKLSKDYGRIFGFSWYPTLGGDGGSINIGKSASTGQITTSSQGTLSGVISNLFPKLHSAKQAGYARILQTGMVVVKDGQQGNIGESGSAPYPVGTGEGQSQAQVATGFNLSVGPKVLENENVEMSIDLSVKMNNGQTADGIPLIVDNKITTIIVTKSKEAAVIGGISFKENSTAYDKDPTGSIDGNSGSFLATLKRSKLYKENKSQYVVFLTAEIIESASQGVEEVRKKFRYR